MQFVQFIAVLLSIVILAGVVELVRRNRLKEKYSLLWLASAAVLLLLSVWRGLLDKIALFLGVAYPPSLLFLVAFLFLLLIVLHYSVIISNLCEKNKRLAQEIAILKEKVGGEKKDFK